MWTNHVRIYSRRLLGDPRLQIHLSVILWGFTAILGRLITLPALPLVWWRMTAVSVVLLAIPRVWTQLRLMSRRLVGGYCVAGCLLAVHWLTFYGSVKLANASVAATCMALTTVLLAFVEPFTNRRRPNQPEILLAVLVVPGVGLVVGAAPAEMGAGVILGALSAVLLAGFGLVNKHLVDHAHPVAITALEFTAGAILLSAIAPFASSPGPAFPVPTRQDALLLLILVFGCTILPFVISLKALRSITAFYAQLAINLEPIYVVLIAAILLREHQTLGWSFYLGAAVMLAAILIQPLLTARSNRHQNEHAGI
jgi:drug/metabolite transporter (DMT)-like permease